MASICEKENSKSEKNENNENLAKINISGSSAAAAWQ
jgi:hypothetical protein